MQIFANTTNIDFMGVRRIAVGLSLLLIIVSVASLALRGLAFGIDFTGGVLVEVGYERAIELDEVRGALGGAGFGDAMVQRFGTSNDVLIRLMPQEGMDGPAIRDRMLAALGVSPDNVRRVEFVGPQVGEELTERGGLAMLVALLLILAYVALRFQWKFAVGAVAALAHDVVLTLGFFSVLQIDFDLSVLAAVLAVIGYSLNDTIVVFDRIRENFLSVRRGTSVDIVNGSINQMLARTIITGVTTLLVLVALFVLGGEVIKPFSIALIVGIVVGTYSSIYVASAAALWLNVSPRDLMPPEKTEGELDSMP